LQAVSDGVLWPEYHGLWHVAPEALTALWREGDRLVREHVMRNSRPAGLVSATGRRLLSEYLMHHPHTGKLTPRPTSEQTRTIQRGVAVFEKTFGRPPSATVAPHYLWTVDTERAWAAASIRVIQGANRRAMQNGWLRCLAVTRLASGCMSATGLTYLARNCRFEPALFGDTADSTFRSVQQAIGLKRPAIIGSHRINFSSRIIPERRDRTLRELTALLQRVRSTWPDVRFMTSAELADSIRRSRSGKKHSSRMVHMIPRMAAMARMAMR